MVRLLKILVIIIILGGVAVVGYAYLGDLSPDRQDITKPVDLNAT